MCKKTSDLVQDGFPYDALQLHQKDKNVVGNLGQKVATNLGRKMTSCPEVQQQQL